MSLTRDQVPQSVLAFLASRDGSLGLFWEVDLSWQGDMLKTESWSFEFLWFA
jgi:hypothetical protein